MKKTTRREALKHLAITPLALGAAGHILSSSENMEQGHKLKGNINHSVCKWCYNDIPLKEFCKASKEIGLQSVELLETKDFATLKEHDLVCAMVSGVPGGITNGEVWKSRPFLIWIMRSSPKCSAGK